MTEDVELFFKLVEENQNLRRTIFQNEQVIWDIIKKLRYRLDPRQYKVLKLRFHERKTYEEVGDELGVTRERIRQLEWQTLERLKNETPTSPRQN